MSAMLLNKEKWSEFTGALAGKNLWAPAVRGETVVFAPLAGDGELLPDCVNSTVPPKTAVFPQTETLYRYTLGQEKTETPRLEGETVLLGVRPCDARAMQIVDRLFGWDVDDPYYLKRRELVTLVGLACNEPGPNCFCASVGGGPGSIEGLDLLMVDLGESYLLEAVTGKGKAILESAAAVLEKAPAGAAKQKEKVIREAEGKITRVVDPAGIPEGLPGLWENELWGKTADSCLGCGSCTFLCPTCHCFDIQDEVEGFAGRRCRMWDSCMFEEYTLHTSGHNPRPTRRERTRNRINHKYNYYVRKFDVIACVGCGRCINSCPVNIDLLEILRQVKEAL